MNKIRWTRKAVKRGGSLMVGIPPELTEAFGIDDGDPLIIEPSSNQIVIFKEKKEGYHHLVKMLPRMEEFWLVHSKGKDNLMKAIKIAEDIHKVVRENGRVDPNSWFKLHQLIGWVGSPTTETVDEFKNELKSYLQELNDEIGSGFNLKKFIYT